MRSSRAVCALACLLALALLAAGCGGGDSTTQDSGEAESRPAPPKGEFPKTEGKSLRDLINSAPDGPSSLVVSPAALVFYAGENRFPFGVFEADRKQVSDAEVALYFSRVPKTNAGAQSRSGNKGAVAKAQEQALDMPAVGPFPASIETIETQPAFRALTTSDDPDAAHVVYSSKLDFPSDGEWRVGAIVKYDGKTTGTLLSSAIAGEFTGIPRPGEKAPMISTPTAEDAGGDLSKITTRVPPDTQNKVDYADVYGKEPILLLFATPQFCESRVCGPVVDVAEQVKETYGDDAAFIHMEIWEDNDPGTEKTRPQVRAFNLPTEPWLFAIDRNGTVVESIEGAFGVEKMTEAVEKAIQG